VFGGTKATKKTTHEFEGVKERASQMKNELVSDIETLSIGRRRRRKSAIILLIN